ncbi:hypothetical protein COB18_00245 [Candidatus Kaiserbacteria bacterium]|nr:MAG: hypothetical protein COB18_00245 [Candidatus Kaiserbacteria bacterium]
MQRFVHISGIFFLVAVFVATPVLVHAQSADELRNKIDTQQSEIAEIEQEIKEFERELTTIGQEKQTLQSAVQQLDVSRSKVNASISLAQRKINSTSANITDLSTDISTKEVRIQQNLDALGETIRRMNEQETGSLVELVLGSKDITALWSDLETIQQFQTMVRSEVDMLAVQKDDLHVVRQQEEVEQNVLVAQKTELSTQEKSLALNRLAKNNLLTQTKSKESSYQDLLSEKRQAKEEFEAELKSFEAELQYILDPTSIPPAGKGVLSWPLTKVTVTQYFGNTKFANGGAYNGSGHNGMDFRASIGTPVKAALSGNVKATGNTDQYRGCYSYGKWILLEHVNGLSTLYAHLSDIDVNVGEAVGTGSVIGYSGNTGYSTGPHLHFSVYAGEAVQVVRLGDIKTRTNCADAKIPVASWSGYLNPLDYL